MIKRINYTFFQTFWLVLLRVSIGWHFLYEGLTKLLNPNWTAYHYLMDSKGWLETFFQDMAGNPSVLSVINAMNIYGLIFAGLGLILGCFSRVASIGAVVLLLMYYLSHSPFIGAEYMMPTEGSYLWIDKNIIEIMALMVLFSFPTSHIIGLDRYIQKFFKRKTI